MEKHVIVLIQANPSKTSRTYIDFNNIADAVDGLIKIYESKLQTQNPGAERVEYTLSDALGFFKDVTDLSCLVHNDAIRAYQPQPREWLMDKIRTTFSTGKQT